MRRPALLPSLAGLVVLLAPAGAAAEPDVLRYTLDLTLTPEAEAITGRATLQVRADGGPTLELDFVGYEIEAVQVNDTLAAWSRDGDRLIVPMEGIGAGEEARVEVRWAGETPPYTAPWGTWGVVWKPDRVFTVNVTEGARTWFPARDVLRDKAELELGVRGPSGWVVAAPGVRVLEEEVGGGQRRTVWRAEWPIAPYLIHFAAGEYEVIEEEHGGVPFVYWLYPGSWEAGASETLAHAPQALEMLVGRYGAYPFPKVGFDEIELGGGLEHPSCISIGSQLFAAAKVYEEVIAHELAHMWFQGVVTIATWEDLWLSEGLATYHEVLYYEHLRGPEAGRAYAASLGLSYRSLAELGEGYFPVYAPQIPFGVTVYRKGALIFHMLRRRVGEATFDAILRAWVEEHRWGSVTTEDFRATAERVSGQALGEFFAQWVYGAGYPEYRVSWRAVEGGAEVRLRQVQSGAIVYTEPVEVELVGDGAAHRVVLEVDGADVTRRVEADFAPTGIVVDPESWLLKEVAEEPWSDAGEEVGVDAGGDGEGDEVGVGDVGADVGMDGEGDIGEVGEAPMARMSEGGGGGCGCGVAGSAWRGGLVGLLVVGLALSGLRRR